MCYLCVRYFLPFVLIFNFFFISIFVSFSCVVSGAIYLAGFMVELRMFWVCFLYIWRHLFHSFYFVYCHYYCCCVFVACYLYCSPHTRLQVQSPVSGKCVWSVGRLLGRLMGCLVGWCTYMSCISLCTYIIYYIYTHARARTHTQHAIYTHIYIYIHAMHKYICIYIYTHTHTHAHIHNMP